MAFTKSHCSCCGQENPDTSDGYTFCCNKSVCGGVTTPFYADKYGVKGNPDKQVKACCWGKAEELFDKKGIKFDKDDDVESWR